jgi:predicted HD phosphohydrolase
LRPEFKGHLAQSHKLTHDATSKRIKPMSDTQTVSFTQMKDGTKEDYELLEKLEKPYLALTPDRVLDELRRQGETTLEGYRITRLQHGLQSATRAEADGADIDWIVGTLLHDVGDGLAPQNHDRFSAEVIRPFVRWEVAWVVEHHGIFQML